MEENTAAPGGIEDVISSPATPAQLAKAGRAVAQSIRDHDEPVGDFIARGLVEVAAWCAPLQPVQVVEVVSAGLAEAGLELHHVTARLLGIWARMAVGERPRGGDLLDGADDVEFCKVIAIDPWGTTDVTMSDEEIETLAYPSSKTWPGRQRQRDEYARAIREQRRLDGAVGRVSKVLAEARGSSGELAVAGLWSLAEAAASRGDFPTVHHLACVAESMVAPFASGSDGLQPGGDDLRSEDMVVAYDAAIPIAEFEIEPTRPPGLVGDLIDWIVSSAERPSRELALGPALCFVGALAGRRFAAPSDLRTNIYAVSLAPSGYGKDHALKAIKRLAEAAGLIRFLGPARIMSASALRNAVKAKPTCLMMMDEFGGFMRQITDKKAGIHNLFIKADLLKFFSCAGTLFSGAEYAGEAASPIHSPNLCIHGTSTQEDFWSSLTSLNAVDGLLARMIIVNVEGAKPDRVHPSSDPRLVPAELVDLCRSLTMSAARGNLSGVTADGTTKCEPAVLALSPDAIDVLDQFEGLIDRWAARLDGGGQSVLHRAREHALKLALTVAAGCGEGAVIDEQIMRWATRLAWRSSCTIIDEIRNRIADNQREADFNRVLRLITNAGPAGITEGTIVDRTRSIEKRARESILDDIKRTGRADHLVISSGRGRPSARWVATGGSRNSSS